MDVNDVKTVVTLVYNYISCNAISAYVIIIEPFSNSCRSGQHGMQCIIHINKICFHTNRALRQLKLKACHQLILLSMYV
ncbi:Regulatory protein SWI4 [Trichinella spiralis]|uniref:Regulatory protein SWI4 n=1 Tax=Trichinella spiralis TaxID=6334 RepID=A0ABR3L0D4_TRISP